MTQAQTYGKESEEEAAQFLRSKGLCVVEKRFLTKWGEIDLIAQDREDWVFVEVKARHRQHDISGLDAITPAKQKKLTMAALMYMKQHQLEGEAMRFDVVSLEAGRIEWLKSAFEPSSRYTF